MEKGAYAWNSQFQQFPGVRGGSIVRRDWWKLWDEAEFPELGTVLVSVDTAIETKESNDYTAATKWGAFEGKSGEPLLILLSAWRARLPLAEVVREVHDMCMGRGEVRDASNAKADYLLIEAKARGRDVNDELLRLYANLPWQIELIKPVGDKVARLTAVSHLFSGDSKRLPDGKDENGKDKHIDIFLGGMIYAPNRDWAQAVIDEVADFPYSSHDDWTDTVSQALGWVRQNGVVLREPEWRDAEYERNVFRRALTVPYAIKRSE
jgi:phage terminase large subunit-like protein